MKKEIKHIFAAAGIAAIIYIIIHSFKKKKELKSEEKPHQWKDVLNDMDYSALRKEAVKGALLGGGTLLVLLGIKTIFNKSEDKDTLTPTQYLKKKIKETKSENSQFSEQQMHFNFVSALCNEEFTEELKFNPILHGSRGKGISIPSSSDYDLAMIFDSNRSGNIETATSEAIERLTPKLKSFGYKVRKQRFTLGVLGIDESGEEFKIDILPAIESSNFDVNDKIWIYNSIDKKRKLTSIKGQNAQFINKPKSREIAVLLKILKENLDLNLPTPVINTLVPNIIEKKGNTSITENLGLALEGISKSITNEKIKDTFNSNNNLTEQMSRKEKTKISSILSDISNDLKDDANNIRKYI